MATTKAPTTVWTAQTLTAGAGDTPSSSLNLTDGYGGNYHIKLTNGATGPTIPAQVQIQTSPDDSFWTNYGPPLIGSVANSAVVSWSDLTIEPGVRFARLVAGSNTTQNVTVAAVFTEITGLI